jgi:hypothetical protein
MVTSSLVNVAITTCLRLLRKHGTISPMVFGAVVAGRVQPPRRSGQGRPAGPFVVAFVHDIEDRLRPKSDGTRNPSVRAIVFGELEPLGSVWLTLLK